MTLYICFQVSVYWPLGPLVSSSSLLPTCSLVYPTSQITCNIHISISSSSPFSEAFGSPINHSDTPAYSLTYELIQGPFITSDTTACIKDTSTSFIIKLL